jgi:hypothetical protein
VDDITSKVGMTTFHVLFETFYRNLGFKWIIYLDWFWEICSFVGKFQK